MFRPRGIGQCRKINNSVFREDFSVRNCDWFVIGVLVCIERKARHKGVEGSKTRPRPSRAPSEGAGKPTSKTQRTQSDGRVTWLIVRDTYCCSDRLFGSPEQVS